MRHLFCRQNAPSCCHNATRGRPPNVRNSRRSWCLWPPVPVPSAKCPRFNVWASAYGLGYGGTHPAWTPHRPPLARFAGSGPALSAHSRASRPPLASIFFAAFTMRSCPLCLVRRSSRTRRMRPRGTLSLLPTGRPRGFPLSPFSNARPLVVMISPAVFQLLRIVSKPSALRVSEIRNPDLPGLAGLAEDPIGTCTRTWNPIGEHVHEFRDAHLYPLPK